MHHQRGPSVQTPEFCEPTQEVLAWLGNTVLLRGRYAPRMGAICGGLVIMARNDRSRRTILDPSSYFTLTFL